MLLHSSPSKSSAHGVVIEEMEEEEDEKEGQWKCWAVARLSCPNTLVPARCETRTRCCPSPTSSSTPLAAATCGRTLAGPSPGWGQRMTSPAAATVTCTSRLASRPRELALAPLSRSYHCLAICLRICSEGGCSCGRFCEALQGERRADEAHSREQHGGECRPRCARRRREGQRF